MNANDDALPSTARLNFGQKVADTLPVHTPDAEVPIAAQDEVMSAEAETEPTETTEALEGGADEPTNVGPLDDTAVSTQVEEVAAVAEPEEDAASEPEEAAGEPEAEDVTEPEEAPKAEPVEETEAAAPEDAEQIDTNPQVDIEAPAATSGKDAKSVEELQVEREKLDAEIKAKQDAQKASVIAQIKTVVDTYSIPVDELVEALGGLKSKRKGIKAKQKFRDPASGVTWSGRGKEPAWIKGQNRDDFLIPEDEQE